MSLFIQLNNDASVDWSVIGNQFISQNFKNLHRQDNKLIDLPDPDNTAFIKIRSKCCVFLNKNVKSNIGSVISISQYGNFTSANWIIVSSVQHYTTTGA